MASISPTTAFVGDYGLKLTWAAMANGDTGVAFDQLSYSDRSVQVIGTFGASGNMQWQGSNDGGTTWATLTDPQGNALDFTTAKIEQVMELAHWVRPKVTNGDGSTAITVVLVARRAYFRGN